MTVNPSVHGIAGESIARRWSCRLVLIVSLILAVCPGAARALVYGIDVSHWNGSIDWGAVSSSGVNFSFVKATEGVSFVDPNVETNVAGATAAGIYAGVYHFATPYSNSVNDAVQEAYHFMDEAGDYMQAGYLPPVLDLEQGSGLGKTVLSNWAKTFLDTVESVMGVRPIIYTGSYYASNFLDAATVDAELWIANWGVDEPNTGSWDDYLFWQFSETGRLPGISTNVDLNEYKGSPSELAALTISVPEPAAALVVMLVGALTIRVRRT